MTHAFSHNPIKLRIIDLKTGQWKKSYIFIGSVPKLIENELKKVETQFNQHKNYQNKILRKFYGKNWHMKLGLIYQPNQKTSIHGRSEKHFDTSDDNTTSLPSPYILGGNEYEIPDDVDLSDTEFNDILNDQTEVSSSSVTDTIDQTQLSDVTQPNLEDRKSLNNIDEELHSDEINTDSLDNKNTDTNLYMFNTTKKSSNLIEKSGQIKFIFKYNVYPSNNILTFKRIIYLVTQIPIYRQHLWFKYKKISYAAQYHIYLFKNIVPIDIETLVPFYLKQQQMEEIENIPIDIKYYQNKDFLQVYAQDTFNLLLTNFTKYGTTEYFLVDCYDLFNPIELYNKLKNNRYQLEIIYYGFIILYFPMMTLSVFLDYLKNEKNISHIYPELMPNFKFLETQAILRQKIIDTAYEAQQAKNKHINRQLFSSIIKTNISINNHKQDIESLLILRNIFDLLALNETITYCKAYLLYENKPLFLKKAYFNEPEPHDILILNSILIKIKINLDTHEYIKLILFKNGNYVIHTEWREERHMTFDKITQIVATKVNPIINMINQMHDKVKHYNISIPLLTKYNIQFTETGLVFYYNEDITEHQFDILKKILIDFQNAGIIMPKESTVIGQEYFFKEGMYKFDVMRLEKLISVNNNYLYLSDSIVKQKWDTVFEKTRLFQILNISSKLKLLISGIRDDLEMQFFNIYLMALLYLYQKQLKHINIKPSTFNIFRKNLKTLKIQDPLLYNFKKIYKSPVIYSKICQKPYQPVILTDQEYNQLSKDKKQRAVRYWNFTKEKPTWYFCPNQKFPYIKFIIKQHPKNYCIPCCKKIAMNEKVNKKKQEIHKICLTTHQYTGEKINLTKGSHYIATYGKDIEVGRLSRLPEHTLEPLFFDTYSPGSIDQECLTSEGYYLFGVDQHTINMKNIGYLYCLVHALQTSLDDFLVDVVKRLNKEYIKFRVLINGDVIKYFTNMQELTHVISLLNINTFIDPKFENVPWNGLFISIAYYFYGINTILFIDQQKERIDLQLPKHLKGIDDMFPYTHKNLVVLTRNQKYYPIYLINTEVFKRTGMIDTKLFLNESGLITTIRAVVRYYFENLEYEKIKSSIDLTVIKKFIKNTHNAQLKGYFINYENLCYAVLIYFQKTYCYVPIFPSYYAIESSIRLIFETYSSAKYGAKINILLDLFNEYNNWVSTESRKAGLKNVNIYPLIKVSQWLSYNNNIIGFMCNYYNYYCQPLSSTAALKLVSAPIQHLIYDPIHINKLILEIRNGQRQLECHKNIDIQVQYSLYKYHLYDLVLMQFIHLFNRQRNHALRRKLLVVLAQTDFNKNMDKLRTFINEKIHDVDDQLKIKNIIGRFLIQHHNKKTMINDIQTSYFNFDNIVLEQFRALSYNQLIKRLHQYAKIFIKIGNINTKNFKFPNILTSCIKADKTLAYCSKNKFIMTKQQLNDILQVIAYDIKNPSKWKWIFNSSFLNHTVNFFKFIRRPYETITVVL